MSDEEIRNFWRLFVWGDPLSSVVDTEKARMNLQHLRKALGIVYLKEQISELENRLSGSEGITSDSITQNKREISLLKEKIAELKKSFNNKIQRIKSGILNDNTKLREKINIDIAKHDKDLVELKEQIENPLSGITEIWRKIEKEIEHDIDKNNKQLNFIQRKHFDLEKVLRELFSSNIEASKRHIKKLKRFSKDMDDWNIYVVEQWKDIRFKKRLLEKLGVGSARQTECKHEFDSKDSVRECTKCNYIEFPHWKKRKEYLTKKEEEDFINIDDLYEDSGDEKSVAPLLESKAVWKDATDSKAPEPIMDGDAVEVDKITGVIIGKYEPRENEEPKYRIYIVCRHCKSSDIKRQGHGNEHCWFCNECKKTCISPIEIKEPRENEMNFELQKRDKEWLEGFNKEFAVVKREDLTKPYRDIMKDLEYWQNANREGISTMYILSDLKSKYARRLGKIKEEHKQ